MPDNPPIGRTGGRSRNRNRALFLKMLASSLVRRRSRVMVALFGIALGGAVLLGMVALSFDIPRQMEQEFRSYGANMIVLPTGDDGLSLTSAADVSARIPPDRLIGMTPFRSASVRNGLVPYTAVATDFESVRKTSPFWQIDGDWPTADSDILIGSDIAQHTRLATGAPFSIEGRNSAGDRFEATFTVSGIVRTGGPEDGFLFLSIPGWEAATEEPYRADLIELSISAGEADLTALAATIRAAVPEADARLVSRVTRSEAAVLGKLSMLVYLVSAVVLGLTMICVATTMTTVVMERRREIGLKKALGAPNRRIALEFLAEGLILGLVGGLVGCAAGLLFAQAISFNVFGRTTAVPWHLIWPTLFVSVSVTLAACLWPVRRAVGIEPALVLRGE